MSQSRSERGQPWGREQQCFPAFEVLMDRARRDQDPSLLFFLVSLSPAEMPPCVPLETINLLHRTGAFWMVLDAVWTRRMRATAEQPGAEGMSGSPPRPPPWGDLSFRNRAFAQERPAVGTLCPSVLSGAVRERRVVSAR